MRCYAKQLCDGQARASDRDVSRSRFRGSPTWIDLNTYLNRWGTLFARFSQFTAFELALGLFLLTALYLLASYLLLRRAVD
jgi:hypothetical protein